MSLKVLTLGSRDATQKGRGSEGKESEGKESEGREEKGGRR